MRKRWQGIGLALLWSALGAVAAPIGLGVPLSAAQLAPYAITIFPDGRNLPPGQGSVAQGAPLFQQHCAGCHGVQGIEGPAARLVGSGGFVGWLPRA